MANNKELTSKNKIVQSLDLYANDILNVSKIVGNKDFDSTRSQDLEISTRDKDTADAGNLLLRAGTSTSGSKGYVHIFAGNTDENATANADGIYVNPDGKIYTTATTQAIVQSGTNNSITLTADGNDLKVDNTTATFNSDVTLTLKTQAAIADTLTNGITLDRTSGDKITALTSDLKETGRNTVIVNNDAAKTDYSEASNLDGKNLIKLTATDNVLEVNATTAKVATADSVLIKTKDSSTGAKNEIKLENTDQKLTIDNENFLQTTEQSYEIKVPSDASVNPSSGTGTYLHIVKPNGTADTLDLITDYADVDVRHNTDVNIGGTYNSNITGAVAQTYQGQVQNVYETGLQAYAQTAVNKIELINTSTAGANQLEITNTQSEINSTSKMTLETQSALGNTATPNQIILERTNNDQTIDIKSNNISEFARQKISEAAATSVLIQANSFNSSDKFAPNTANPNYIELKSNNQELTVKNNTATYDSTTSLTLKSQAANETNSIVLSSADSSTTPGLQIQNNYTKLTSDQQVEVLVADANNTVKLESNGNKLTVDNSTALLNSDTVMVLSAEGTLGTASATATGSTTNRITLSKDKDSNTAGDQAAIDLATGTLTGTGTSQVTFQVPNSTAASNTYITLQTTNQTLQVQAANGYKTEVLAGNSEETISTGSKSITTSDTTNGTITLDAAKDIIVKSESADGKNRIQLTKASDKLEVKNANATLNSTGTLLLENNSSLSDTPSTNYIKLSNKDDIDIKAGDITETGTTSITLKADDDSNKIVLASLDDSLTATNALETHNTENEFKILVPSTASINNIQSDNFTATGTILDIVATTVNNQTSTETKLSSDSINIASMGNVRSQSKRNLYLAAGLGYNSSNPDVLNNNEILIGLKDIESENSIRLSQTEGSKHDVLEVRNGYTRVNTSNYDLTASDKLKIQSSNHGAGGHDRHAAFELDAELTKAIVKLNDLKVNQSIKLGNTVTGDTTGLDTVNSVPAGTASVTVAGAISKLGLTGADNNLAVQLGGLKLGDNVSAGSAAANETLLEVEHANVTGYTRVNNLDITGEIRIGAVASASASASSGLTKADNSSIGVNFSNFSTVADTAHAASASDLIVNVQDFSLNATQTGIINTRSTLDIDSTGALTIDSANSISIGTTASKPVTINASELQITGDSAASTGATDALQISSQGDGGNYAAATQSYVKADVVHVKQDFYGNNIHMYWDEDTQSLVFARVTSV